MVLVPGAACPSYRLLMETPLLPTSPKRTFPQHRVLQCWIRGAPAAGVV